MGALSDWYKEGTEQSKAAKKLAVAVMGIGALAFFGTIGSLLVAGITNLVILGALAFVGVVFVQIAPWLSRYLTLKGKNFFIDKLKQEAAENPITTRQQLWIQRSEELEHAETAIAEQEGEINSFKDQIYHLKQDFPEEDHSDMEAALRTMQQAQAQMVADLSDAKTNHEEVGRKIQFASKKWEAAKKIDKIMERLDPKGQNAAMRKILEEVAIDSADSKFNASLGKLKISMATRGKPKIIDVTPEQAVIPPVIGMQQQAIKVQR